MFDYDASAPHPDTFKDAATRGQEAGIANETAASTADKEQMDEPSDKAAAAQLGGLS